MALVSVADMDRVEAEAAATVDAAACKLDALLARWDARNSAKIDPNRVDKLRRAIELGADDKALFALVDARRTSDISTIVLPAQRFENLSRGKGWCRRGRGSNATWGEREDGGGYRVGPGKWTVGGSDGFNRKGSDDWTVSHIQVGDEIWTVAV